MEKVGFLIIYLTLISVLLVLAYITQKVQKTAPMFGTIFVVIVLIGAAFYLFQFGPLSSFTIKAMSAEATFVKEKVKEVKEDAETINALRQAIESQAKRLTDSVKKSESVAKNLDKIQVEVKAQAKTVNLITTKVEAQAKTIDVIIDRVKREFSEVQSLGANPKMVPEASVEHPGGEPKRAP